RGELQWVAQSSGQIPVVKKAVASQPYARIAGIAALAVLAGFLAAYKLRPASTAPLFWLQIAPPDKNSFTTMGLGGAPVISPDGAKLAFVATSEEGKRSLWFRQLDSAIATQLPDTDEATYPFWSADSNSVAFFSANVLRRVDITSGATMNIAEVPEGRGGSWS